MLAYGHWFSPGTPASSTTKTGRNDIAEILLKVTLKHQKSINQIKFEINDAPTKSLDIKADYKPRPVVCITDMIGRSKVVDERLKYMTNDITTNEMSLF